MEGDYILDGKGFGGVANTLLQHGMDPNVLRPFLGEDGRTYITKNVRGVDTAIPVANAVATLRKDEWIQLDETVIRIAQDRLAAVADLRAAGLTYTINRGMGKTVLQYQDQSDINPATISMDGLRRGDSDRPEYDLKNLPLPITHKDFWFTAREIETSRNDGSPLDTTMVELATRKVTESLEDMLCGVSNVFSYGGGNLYGYKNFPQRIGYTITAPTAVGWTPAQTIADVLAMIDAARQKKHYGPFFLYNSGAFEQYLDDDYSAAKGDRTLRERLLALTKISGIRTLDHLGDGFSLILVEKSSDTVREVIAMDFKTLQWASEGGMRLDFKVMCIMVPQLRCDQDENCGIVDGETA